MWTRYHQVPLGANGFHKEVLLSLCLSLSVPMNAIGLVELVSFHQFTKWTSLVMEKDKDWPDFGLIHHPLINFFGIFWQNLLKQLVGQLSVISKKRGILTNVEKLHFFLFFKKKFWRHSEKKCLEKFFWTELFWPFRQIFNSLKNYRILQLGLKRWVLKVAKLLYLLQSYGRNLL